MLVQIGDKRRELKDEHLKKLRDLIVKEKLDNFMLVTKVLTKCILLMPHKTQLYAALLSMIAVEDYELALAFWEAFCNQVKEDQTLFEDDGFKAINIYVFTSQCAALGLVQAEPLIDSLTAKLNKSESYPLLFALNSYPILEQTGKATGLFEAIKNVMTSRKKTYSSACKLFLSQSASDKDQLDSLWEAIVSRKANFSCPTDFNASDALLSEIKENLKDKGSPLLPEVQTSETYFPLPTFFEVEMQGAKDKLDSLRAVQKAQSIIYAFKDRYQMAALNLSEMQLENLSGSLTNDFQQIALSAILSLLFRLPESPCKPLFFALLTIDISNKIGLLGAEKKQEFSQKVQSHIKTLFAKAHEMDREVREIFLEFTAHFIYESEFKFDFEFLKENIENQKSNVSELLQKLSNVSFYKTLQKVLPEFLHPLLSSGE